MPTQATRKTTAGAATRRPGRPSKAQKTLDRVQRILQETCEQDGQGRNLQEVARRKAYRAGINKALEVITVMDRAG